MARENFAFQVRCWRSAPTEHTMMQVIDVATGQEVPFEGGNFILQVVLDNEPANMRCKVRHLESGQEIFLQSGLLLPDFIKACLLSKPSQSQPDT